MGLDGIMDNYPINPLNGFKWAIDHHHGHMYIYIYISPAFPSNKKGDATMEMSGSFLGKICELYVAVPIAWCIFWPNVQTVGLTQNRNPHVC